MSKNKLHLLIVVRWPVGGIRTFLRYVYSHFGENEYRLTLILPETSELQATFENLEQTDSKFVVLAKNPSALNFIGAIVKTIKKETVDLIHSHGFSSGIYSALPAKFYKIPHLFTSHDILTDKQFLGMKGRFKKIILKNCLKLMDRIHSVGNDAQANLLTYFPELKTHPNKLIVILNGIEVERFLGMGKIDWRQKLSLPDNAFLIGFFGRFMAQKGFKYLVEAIDELKKNPINYKIPIVLAFGWGGFIREEQAEISQKGLQDSFRFLPFQENIAKAIRGTDIVAMPSLWEAYSLLPAEVMIAGIPVIGTNCIGLREVLHNTPARVIPASDYRGLAEALADEMKNPSHPIMEPYRQEAAKRFDVRQQVEGLKKLIKKMLVSY